MSDDPWASLRGWTPARIGRGRAGSSLPTSERLAFALDHATARDAVSAAMDVEALTSSLAPLGLPVVIGETAATTAEEHLLRPDLGRRLSVATREALATRNATDPDLVIVVAGGLSAAATRSAPPLLSALLPALGAQGWSIGPLVVLCRGRVAVADEVGELLGARLSLILLGERPGLSAPDSLGAYLTFGPRPGRTDAERNCVSNIRPDGLPAALAAATLLRLLLAGRALGASGIALKDDAPRGLEQSESTPQTRLDPG